MPAGEPVLLGGLSVRALAESAAAAGFAPIALDAFGDLDTQAAATAWIRLPVDEQWCFRKAALLAAAARLAPGPVPLVWGSGFERAPELLAALARNRPLWGCEPMVVRRVKDPLVFATIAGQLGIAHPEIRREPPAQPHGWLCKRTGAAGGGHVMHATAEPPQGRGWYWQRLAPGRPVSALVVGDGRRARTLGLSEQWTVADQRQPFRYAGTMVPARLSTAAAASLRDAAEKLAATFAIRGLASVDALIAGDAVTVLELNPRPGASFETYTLATGTNLFRVHAAACRGVLPETALLVARVAGCAIVHARQSSMVPWTMDWPDWTGDRSPSGTAIKVGGPICTVRATGTDAATVHDVLERRARTILAAMEPAGGSSLIRTNSVAGTMSGGAAGHE